MLLRLHFYIYSLGLTLSLGSVQCIRAANASVAGREVLFDVAPAPSWVKAIEPGSDVRIGADSTGIVYLLADRQENLQRNAFYYHEVRKIISEKGIESGASIAARFNPTFEKLIFNSIKVTRNGTVSDRLDRSRIELVAKEKEPERSSYDPSLSARMVLEDVRVGDVVELALTIEGANPLNRGKYSKIYLVQWEALIIRNVLRLVHSADWKVAVQAENGARQPTITTANGVTEVWYEDNNVPGRNIENDVPDDYEPRQLLEVSDFHSWAEVAQWAMPLFETEPAQSSEFNFEAEKLRAIANPDQRVAAALQFVQDEIRYVKAGVGPATHCLTPPDETLQRHSGNHVDKALLLVALLRAVQIDAAPALASGTFWGTIRKFLPSADVLDHAIVQVRIGQSTWWLNPAATDQRGPLSQRYVRPYGYVLVLRPGTAALTPLQTTPGSFPVKKITENYRIPPPDKIPDLEVISEYRGLAADRTRGFFRENTHEEIQKRYLEYYARMFPDAKVQTELRYEELPGEDACRVTESYIVPRLWQLNGDKSRYALYVQPMEIYSAIGSTISPKREDPLRLEYPNTVLEEINIQMFEDWPFNADGESINNEFFRISDKPSGDGATLQFRYSYETLKDRIEIAQIEKFNEAISKAKDSLGYTLRYQTPEQIRKRKSLSAFNWAVGAGAFCFFAMSGLFAWGYFRQSKLAEPMPPPIDAPAWLNGIGGWLLLLAIGQALLPLRFLPPIYKIFSTTMDTNSWRSLTDPIESSYNAWWAPTLLFELFFNLGALVFAVLLIALFFTKKAAWRRAFALFSIFFLVGAVLDTVLVDRIPSAAEPLLTSVVGVAPIVLASAIWIPYVLFSKRVKATFRY